MSTRRSAARRARRDVRPIISSDSIHGEPADRMAARASDTGVGSVIVIDLARVGTGSGLGRALIARVRDAVPGVTLVAGGGEP